MKAVYLIGNGFDINCGLNTKAQHIVADYRSSLVKDLAELQGNADSGHAAAGLSALLEEISSDPRTWADFEMSLGRFTAVCEGSPAALEMFRRAFAHFREFLVGQLQHEEDLIQKAEIPLNTLKLFYSKTLDFMRGGMRPAQRTVVDQFLQQNARENWTINFIDFNYTTLIDRLVNEMCASDISQRAIVGGNSYGRSITSPVHIHGTLSDDHGILVGVDRLDQIEGISIRESDELSLALTKPLLNHACMDERDLAAMNLIREADIICVYGMSLGESDLTWWEEIGNWLCRKPEEKLFVIARRFSPANKAQPEAFAQESKGYLQLFHDRSGIPQETWSAVSSRIIVTSAVGAFDIGVDELVAKVRESLNISSNVG